ncbi:hypothetical protein ACFUMH_07815 [Cellulomonas sp. NPDC057328]|uniref:hypothetical protein n=1 Tax=Cellulomonas sp. NPDC057328 TaxID=3346101 RepID=UPI003642B403
MTKAAHRRDAVVRRLSDIEAGQQAAYLDPTQEYHGELARLDESVLAASRRYLAAHGIAMP